MLHKTTPSKNSQNNKNRKIPMNQNPSNKITNPNKMRNRRKKNTHYKKTNNE